MYCRYVGAQFSTFYKRCFVFYLKSESSESRDEYQRRPSALQFYPAEDVEFLCCNHHPVLDCFCLVWFWTNHSRIALTEMYTSHPNEVPKVNVKANQTFSTIPLEHWFSIIFCHAPYQSNTPTAFTPWGSFKLMDLFVGPLLTVALLCPCHFWLDAAVGWCLWPKHHHTLRLFK